MTGHRVLLSLGIFLVLLTACQVGAGGDSDPSATPEWLTGQAEVESLEVLILESFPVQVQVVARGSLPDGCTTIESASISREGTSFTDIISTERPAEAICTDVLISFERVIPLDVEGLLAGEYSVSVNEVTAFFENHGP